MFVSNDIKYVGVNDHIIDLFEGQYDVPNGMAYNSYAIIDKKIAIMDSVDKNFTQQWLNNIKDALGDRTPDYLVVQHMEPDHSANIISFLDAYPDAKLVASSKAFVMMKNFFGKDFADKQVVVKEGDALNLGEHELSFIAAPMVHWPEVIMTYDKKDKVLFSADAFGKFGALDVDEDWACEARRYYFGIVGKYGVQVQSVLKKAAALDIKTICPLHGPVLCDNLEYYIDLYNKWSSYIPEEKGVMLAYTSVYGNTKEAVMYLADKLKEAGAEKVVINDLARVDMHEAVEDAFRYDRLVLATTTYNADIFPFMRQFIDHLIERNFKNRKVALIENGSWAPIAAKVMKEMLSKCAELEFVDTQVKIMSAVNNDNKAQLDAMAKQLCGDNKNSGGESSMKYACDVCGWVYDETAGSPENGIAPGTAFDDLPEDFVCPLCGVSKDDFSKVD